MAVQLVQDEELFWGSHSHFARDLSRRSIVFVHYLSFVAARQAAADDTLSRPASQKIHWSRFGNDRIQKKGACGGKVRGKDQEDLMVLLVVLGDESVERNDVAGQAQDRQLSRGFLVADMVGEKLETEQNLIVKTVIVDEVDTLGVRRALWEAAVQEQ